jgi:quercetin dioxygenase-like cupin family protein
MTVTATKALRPPELHFTMTGETFEFLTSAKGGDGVFRFRWTLAAGKKGPPEHVHDDESETFAVVSGVLRIWLDGEARELQPGDSVTVAPGTRHRFLNPGDVPVVVDVSLDGPRQEDALVPLAFHLEGRRSLRLADFLVMLAHAGDVGASRPPSAAAAAFFRALGRASRLLGARPLPRAGAWAPASP